MSDGAHGHQLYAHGADPASAGNASSSNGIGMKRDSPSDGPSPGMAYPESKKRRTSSTSFTAPTPPTTASAVPSKARGAGATPSTSSRGVANLTPDQLAKKRANDREAQRAIRQRTKDQIERLQNTIDELTSQQPYVELQNAIRQKELVEAENADIKRRLASVLAIIQPILGQNSLDIPAYTPPVPPPYIPHRASLGSNMNVSTPSSAASPMTGGTGPSQWQSPVAHEPQRYPPVQTSQPKQATPQRQDMPPSNYDMAPDRIGLDFLLDSGQRIPADASAAGKTPNGVNGVPAPSSFHQIPRELERVGAHHHHHHGSSGQRSSSITSSSTTFSTPFSPSTNSTSTGHSLSPSNPDAATVSAHSAPIRNGPATCPLDSLLLGFLRDRQTLLAEGAPPSHVLGPALPDVSALLHPARSAHSHALSKVFTDVLATFPDLSALPEQVALLYLMFLLMRWQIAPTAANYDRLPDWLAPRPAQLFTPHPAWIDHLPWPRMRDRLVRDYAPREYLFDNFVTPFTEGLSVNWPYEPASALMSVSTGREGPGAESEGAGGRPPGKEWVINPDFERHLRTLENWTLPAAFERRFPGLKGTFGVKGG